jgi:hypothetical protein
MQKIVFFSTVIGAKNELIKLEFIKNKLFSYD